MFNFNRFGLTMTYLLLLSGCATQLQQMGQSMDVASKPNSQQSVEEAKALYEIGKNYQNEGKLNEALIAYEKALALNSEDPDIYNGLGIIYSLLGEHDLAIPLITEAIRFLPMASYLHNNLGYVYLSQQRYVEAAGAFERALQLNPENSYARHNLDMAYEKLGCANNQPPCGQWQEPKQP